MMLTPLKSAVSGMIWPTLPNVAEAQILAIYRQLEQSQYWPEDRLRERQGDQLSHLLRHARATVPHYSDMELPLTVEGQMDWDAFRALPVLGREVLQKNKSALISNNVPQSDQPNVDFTTSGSTGMPVSVIWTTLANRFVTATNLRYHIWHGSDPKGKQVSLRAVPMKADGTSTEPRGHSWYPLADCGENAAFNAALPVSQQVAWLQKENPDYLMTYPSNARAIAQYAIRNGLPLPNLKRIDTFGESMADGLRDAAQKAWGVPVVDKYSAREVGAMAIQCPDQDGYHTQSEDIIVEIIREDGKPAGPGETGRVIATPLHNFAMPLIRYDIGDYAEVGTPCPCGRGLPRLSQIHGRSRNMLVLPDGDRLWPRFNSDDLNQVAPIRQFQIIQKSLEMIEIRVVQERNMTRDEETALRALLKDRLPGDFDLPIIRVDEIPRTKSGKYEDFKCEIASE